MWESPSLGNAILILRRAQLPFQRNTSGLYLYNCWVFFIFLTSNENIFRVTAPCAGKSPVPSEFPAQRPVTRSFDVFFDLRLNKRLSKQTWGWWFETLSRPWWRHCNVIAVPGDVLPPKPSAGTAITKELTLFISKLFRQSWIRTFWWLERTIWPTWFREILRYLRKLINLSLVPHICVTELDHRWFR